MVMREGAGCVFRLSAFPSIAGIASHCREPPLSAQFRTPALQQMAPPLDHLGGAQQE